MSKRIISCMLLSSFLFYLGCYNTTRVTKEEFAAAGQQTSILVSTRDGKHYEFDKGNYQIVGDSISGSGIQKTRPPISDIRFRGTIALSNITLIETTEFSTGKTILLAGGIGLAVAGIIALTNGGNESSPPPPPPPSSGGGTKFSCPFIYTFDGAEYHLESETFAGAVLKGLERPAFDVLYHIKPSNGLCRMKVVNARQETEYINEVKLLAVDHPVGTIIIPDRKGSMRTIAHPVEPAACVTLDGRSVLNEIARKDLWYWKSDLANRKWNDPKNLRDGLVVEFPKPADTKTVKLVVSGKNTQLGYFALEKIFTLMGNQKSQWHSRLENDSASLKGFAGWLMREGMLHVQLWQQDKWVEKTALMDVGPGISKDQVAVLDVSKIADNVLKVRLECTTDLWQIDQIYADYSADRPIHIAELPLRSAINEHGDDVSNLLASSDDEYYATVSDQYADLQFIEAPRPFGTQRSYVVMTRGFYYQWLTSTGAADEETVQRILSEPGFGTKLLMPEWLMESERAKARASVSVPGQ